MGPYSKVSFRTFPCLVLFFLVAGFFVFASLPALAGESSWTEKLKLKGDFRLRHQVQKETDKEQRSRERIRFRLVGTAKLSSRWNVGFGFATGGDDPRSTNQTLEGTFSTPDIRLDYAYAAFNPSEDVSLWGGKYRGIKNAIWRPTDILWDSDLRPEGVGAKLRGRMEKVELFGNFALFVLDEAKADEEPLMFVVQPGVKVLISDNAYFKASFAYYPTSNLKGRMLEHSSGTNNSLFITGEGDTLNALVNEYNSYEPSVELGVSDIFGGAVENLSVFASYVSNPGADSLNTGYAAGVKVGSKKVKGRGQWLIKYLRRRLERDAWLDVFPDSDAFGGRTDVEGDEVVLEIGLAHNTVLVFDYYRMDRISGERSEDLLQVDLLLKF